MTARGPRPRAGPAKRRRGRTSQDAPPPPALDFVPLPPGVGLGTRAVHAGRRPELNAGALVPPIYQTSTFHFPAAYSEAAPRGRVHLYTRYTNPTQEAAAEVLRTLEGAEAARVFASGMAAISSAVLAFVRAGDTVVAPVELYGGSLDLLRDVLPRFGVTVRWVPADARDPTPFFRDRPRVALLETPTNPRLTVHDLRAWADVAHAAGALLLVDNTFATPINQRPLGLGADLVLHSASKSLGGHSDLIAGAVAGRRELVDRVEPMLRILGGTLDPFAAFLLHRGLRTLPLRVARHNENGRRVVEALAEHPAVERIHYPGRASAEEERIAARQMVGRGGVLSLELRGGRTTVERFLHRLQLVQVAASLGGVESLASVPALTSHAHLTAEERRRLGLSEGLVRISLGIEDPDDLVRDLRDALGPR